MKDLRVLKLSSNYHVKNLELPHFLVANQGATVERMAEVLVDRIESEKQSDLKVGWTDDQTNLSGQNRPLRFIQQFSKGHVNATDVILGKKGNDLYVRFRSVSRTRISLLRLSFRLSFFAVLFAVLAYTYVSIGGALNSWYLEYAQKHADEEGLNGKTGLFHSILNGQAYSLDMEKARAYSDSTGNYLSADGANKLDYYLIGTIFWYNGFQQIKLDSPRYREEVFFVSGKPNVIDYAQPQNMITGIVFDEALKDSVMQEAKRMLNNEDIEQELLDTSILVKGERVGIIDLAKEDPKLFFFAMGMPATIIAGIIGVLTALLPASVLRRPCRWLGWPTPEEYDNFVNSSNAWVGSRFSEILLHDFGITEDMIQHIKSTSK